MNLYHLDICMPFITRKKTKIEETKTYYKLLMIIKIIICYLLQRENKYW